MGETGRMFCMRCPLAAFFDRDGSRVRIKPDAGVKIYAGRLYGGPMKRRVGRACWIGPFGVCFVCKTARRFPLAVFFRFAGSLRKRG